MYQRQIQYCFSVDHKTWEQKIAQFREMSAVLSGFQDYDLNKSRLRTCVLWNPYSFNNLINKMFYSGHFQCITSGMRCPFLYFNLCPKSWVCNKAFLHIDLHKLCIFTTYSEDANSQGPGPQIPVCAVQRFGRTRNSHLGSSLAQIHHFQHFPGRKNISSRLCIAEVCIKANTGSALHISISFKCLIDLNPYTCLIQPNCSRIISNAQVCPDLICHVPAFLSTSLETKIKLRCILNITPWVILYSKLLILKQD